jgi:hypothetical protein
VSQSAPQQGLLGEGTEVEKQFHPDDAYKMPSIEGVKLSPANIIRCIWPYVSKDETRLALMFINVNDHFIQATDGHRFIRLERDRMVVPIPNGAFRAVKDGKDFILIALPHNLDLPFPNADTHMPEKWDTTLELKAFDPKGLGDIAQLLYKLAKLDICISHHYAEDLPAGDYQVLVSGPGKAVIFIGDYTAGIMPLKLAEGK